MNTLFIGKNFVDLGVVESTNSLAGQLLESRPAEGTVVRAKYQTAGRGQLGSSWNAATGENLTFSIVLYPQFLQPRQIFLLNKLIAIAIRNVIAALLPESKVQVKWPNDILIDRKKVAGILIETTLDAHSIRSAVIGIGLNVNQTAFEAAVHGSATSLASVAGKVFDLDGVLAQILEAIEAGYLAIRAGRAAGIEHDYLKHLFAYQEDAEVEVAGERKVVHIVGVDADGRLAVQTAGKLYFYAVKEIKFIL